MTWGPGGGHLEAKVPRYGRLNFQRRAVRKLRRDVYFRDHFTCQLCGFTPKSVPLHYDGSPGCYELWGLEIDHIVPRSHGGDNSITNLQTLCEGCNRHKQARLGARSEC